MNTFVVATGEDKKQFIQLASKNNIPIQVVVRKIMPRIRLRPDTPGTLSIASCITVENDQAWNVLLDWARIGSTGIVDTFQQAQDLIQVSNGRSIR